MEQPRNLEYTRADLIEQLKTERAMHNKEIVAMLDAYLDNQVAEAGLTDRMKGELYRATKEAALYFDAGFVGESIKTLNRARGLAKNTGFGPYFLEISLDLQHALDTFTVLPATEKSINLETEKSLRDIAIDAIKFLGADDPDAQLRLANWRRVEDKENSTFQGEERVEAEIDSTIYEAEIYFEAGCKEKALEVLKEALDTAIAENLFDAQKHIALKMQEYSQS